MTGPVNTPQRPTLPPGYDPGDPGNTPDYLALIKQSPAYQSWLANANTQKGSLATTRAAAIRQLALQYGGLPTGFTDAFGDLRPEDLAAESGNQFSVQEQLKRTDAQAREAMHRSLAARGMLQSGDLGYGEQQADTAKGQAEQDAAAAFLQALGGAVGDYSSGVGNIDAGEAPLIAQLLPLIMQLYPATPARPGDPNPVVPAAPAAPRSAHPGPVVVRPHMPVVRPRPGGRQP